MYIYKTVALEQFLQENKDKRIGVFSSGSQLGLAVKASKAVESLLNYFAKDGWEYVKSEEFRADFFTSSMGSLMTNTNPLLQMFIFRKENIEELSTLAESNSETSLATQRDLNDDFYKIYLQRKFLIERNSIFNKIICKNKFFENIEDALIYANTLEAEEMLIKEKEKNDISVILNKSVNHKLIYDKNFNEFEDLGFRCLFLDNGNCAIEASKNIFYIYDSTEACRYATLQFTTKEKKWVAKNYVEKVDLSTSN